MTRSARRSAFASLPEDFGRALAAIYRPGSRLEPGDLRKELSERLRDWKLRDNFEDRFGHQLFGLTDDATWVRLAARGYKVGRVVRKSLTTRRVRGILAEKPTIEETSNACAVADGSPYARREELAMKSRRERWNALIDSGSFDIHEAYAALATLVEEGRSIRIPDARRTKCRRRGPAPRDGLQRGALRRCLNTGMSPKQIAAKLGCSLTTVYRHLKRHSLRPSP